MDVTIANAMDLSLEAAKEYCCSVIDTVEKYNGELVLLWHNTEFEFESKRGEYQIELYNSIINHLSNSSNKYPPLSD